MSRYEWAALVWGAWFGLFVVLEVAGWRGWAPWPTLSQTAWQLERSWSFAPVVFLAGLAVLLVHIVFRFPDRQWRRRRR